MLYFYQIKKIIRRANLEQSGDAKPRIRPLHGQRMAGLPKECGMSTWIDRNHPGALAAGEGATSFSRAGRP